MPSKPVPHGCCCQVLLPAWKGAWPLWTTALCAEKHFHGQRLLRTSEPLELRLSSFEWIGIILSVSKWCCSLHQLQVLLQHQLDHLIFLTQGFLCQANLSIIFKVSYTWVPRTRAEWSQICGQIPHEWPQPSWYLSPSKTWLQSTFLCICDSHAPTRTTQ